MRYVNRTEFVVLSALNALRQGKRVLIASATEQGANAIYQRIKQLAGSEFRPELLSMNHSTQSPEEQAKANEIHTRDRDRDRANKEAD